ncbi:ABC transporter ATP-binding protein [Xanthomonas campestris]|uniref:ABC transporter ATP-binding protein n=1 Tax=Xanthomonas campestris TaxID=339 RepID=UPI000E0F8E51|nr:ABC transporter ATP-binding protein [Xanthomonas campestris]MEB2233094.1 ABC transporter ATP-binding protein [Xanthomonas campestris pv. campestris]
MSSELPIIEVQGLSKSYFIYDSPRDRLKQFVLPSARRALGLSQKNYYHQFHALENVEFTVGRGETVGIIGRNGCGKSTLLQMVCGTLNPTSGKVVTRGRIAALLELGSGFNPEFSGRENVFLNAAILGLSQEEISAKYDDIARFADIGRFIDQPIKTYSSGMVVRLAFSTAIHVDPDILVVDEALSVGDTAFQQKCLNRIRQMQRQGVSILLVTHSSNALVEYCDRGVYLRKGRLVMDAPCRDVVKAYADDLVEEEGGITYRNDEDLADEQPADAPSSKVDVGELQENAPIRVLAVSLMKPEGGRVSAISRGDTLIVKITVRSNVEIPVPCFGIQILSVDGIALWSATTQSMDARMQSMAPGEYHLEWTLTANFSGNRYVVAVGVGHIENGEYRRTHRVPYAGHFDVVHEPSGGAGWLAPLPVLTLSRSVEQK